MFSDFWHRRIYLIGLFILAIGLPTSPILMSVSQMILSANWLLSGNPLPKFKAFFSNKAALSSSIIFFLLIVGLMYTENLKDGFDLIRIQLPLLVIPLVISTTIALNEREIKFILLGFIGAVLTSAIISTFIYFRLIPYKFDDIRKIAVFISHIRFSLMVDLSIFILGYFIFQKNKIEKTVLFYAFIVLCLLSFLFILKSMTGIILLLVVLLVVLLYLSLQQKKLIYRLIYNFFLLIIPILAGIYLYTSIREFYTVENVDFESLDLLTANGEPYDNNIHSRKIENGYYVWIYVAKGEMEESWVKRSSLDFNGKDKKGQVLFHTLTRFLASKGLRKDGQGMSQLNDNEIKAIENGIANYRFITGNSIRIRLYKIIWEFHAYYFNGERPEGNSVTQRIEFWETALDVIKSTPIMGVGTGDLQEEMNKKYDERKAVIAKEYWLKPHNQFLSYTVLFGIFGLIIFLLSLFYAPLKLALFSDYYFGIFFIIILLSMLTEDTLFTQAGVTFYAFFNALFLFRERQTTI